MGTAWMDSPMVISVQSDIIINAQLGMNNCPKMGRPFSAYVEWFAGYP